jgi:histone deacetylase complex subunit SAP18
MASPQTNRQTTTPFLLRLFYKNQSFHSLSDFDPTARLPPHLQIYTWPSCSLRELSSLLLTALPNLLPKPYAGTRIAFRLVYGDMTGPNRPGAPGRFISRELGSVVVGARTNGDAEGMDVDVEEASSAGDVAEALKQLDGEPEKTLGDAKFVIGDYVACAILPPLADGTVQAAPAPLPTGPRGPPPRDNFGGGRRGDYSNGFGGRGDFGGGYGRGRGRGGRW